MTAIINFFIRLWFYPRYFFGFGTLRHHKINSMFFNSFSVNDGQWIDKWGWIRTREKFRYGIVCFFAQMDGEFQENYWPALWMAESGDTFYNEIDIELTIKSSRHPYLNLAVWDNRVNSDPHGKVSVHKSLQLRNQRLIKQLRQQFHMYYIDWRSRGVKFYIDGLLCGMLWQAPQNDMHIVVGYATVTQIVMYNDI